MKNNFSKSPMVAEAMVEERVLMEEDVEVEAEVMEEEVQNSIKKWLNAISVTN
ncbi:hypothetical protein A2U01_0087723 [Trifolium medium]|uniref:Uncharacterized protein n=1 Tax=Trifolium medium TaxID=97028 RepID=A0A392U353_9FABA|nr:hypothetical protein [Trifolium medium]